MKTISIRAPAENEVWMSRDRHGGDYRKSESRRYWLFHGTKRTWIGDCGSDEEVFGSTSGGYSYPAEMTSMELANPITEWSFYTPSFGEFLRKRFAEYEAEKRAHLEENLSLLRRRAESLFLGKESQYRK